jgi:hypothetical protein
MIDPLMYKHAQFHTGFTLEEMEVLTKALTAYMGNTICEDDPQWSVAAELHIFLMEQQQKGLELITQHSESPTAIH